MKYKFECSVIIEATSEEDALSKIGSNLATVSRQIGSERKLDDCAPMFTLVPADKNAESIKLEDSATDQHGPIELSLDPNSSAGKALASQKEAEAEQQKADAVRAERASRSDAEIMAEHSENEQATLNAPPERQTISQGDVGRLDANAL